MLHCGVNCAGFVLTGDVSWTILYRLMSYLRLSATETAGDILAALQVCSVPLILLLMGVFYLWVYARQARGPVDVRAFPGPQKLGTGGTQ